MKEASLKVTYGLMATLQLSGKGRTVEAVKGEWLPGWEQGVISRPSREDARGSENTPRGVRTTDVHPDVRIMEVRHYTFVRVLECATPKVSPKVHYELWVIMRSRCRFIFGKKCERDVNDGEGYACAGAGGTGEVSALPSQFCY